jgi:hypothetical protein
VCRAEAANVAMAVKLLYSMQGPLPKVLHSSMRELEKK